MLKPMRNLLALAALCWVVPVTAQPSNVAAKQHVDADDCPQARAKAKAVQRKSQVVVIKAPMGASLSLFGRSTLFAP